MIVSNSLGPDQAREYAGPDRGPKTTTVDQEIKIREFAKRFITVQQR